MKKQGGQDIIEFTLMVPLFLYVFLRLWLAAFSFETT